MAIGMKQWVALTLIGCAGVAAWKLPPSQSPLRVGEKSPEAIRRDGLASEIRRAEGAWLRWHLSDSLSARTVSAPGGWIVDASAETVTRGSAGEIPFVESEALDLIRDRFAIEVSVAAPAGSEVALGFFLSSRSPRLSRENGMFASVIEDYYLGTRDGRPYCIRVQGSGGRITARGVSRTEWSNNLAGCRIPARYGLPGPAIARWLRTGAINFGNRTSRGLYWEPPRGETATARVRTAGGWLQQGRCFAGQAAACAAAILDPQPVNELAEDDRWITENTPATSIRRDHYTSMFGTADDYLFADLEAEFGPERFAAFWTSELEVPQAFEAAFGVDLGEWVVGWTERNLRITRRSPHVSRAGMIGLMWLMVLAGGLSAVTSRRRQVG